jgi:hypothetical protein
MTITSGAFDEHGIPQGSRNRLDDLADVDTAEAEDGNTIAMRNGRWVPVGGNEVAVATTVPEDMDVELWVHPDEDPITEGGPVATDPAVGMVWDGTYYGVQRTPIGANGAGGPSVLFGAAGSQDAHLIASGTGAVILRPGPATGVANDLRVTSAGVQVEGPAPAAAGALGAVIKFKWGTVGDDRGIGLRDMTDYGHPAGVAMAAINYPEGTLAPISVLNPGAPQHAVSRAWLETVSAGVIAYSDGWSNYGGAFGTAQPVLSTNGLVTMEGIFRHAGKAVAPGTAYSAAVLPVGYRPVAHQVFTGSSGNPPQALRIDLDVTGVVTFIPTASATITFLSFGGSTWRAA